ncbi:hypothetical protein O3P69_012572, partial [Scylla paramamosain]
RSAYSCSDRCSFLNPGRSYCIDPRGSPRPHIHVLHAHAHADHQGDAEHELSDFEKENLLFAFPQPSVSCFRSSVHLPGRNPDCCTLNRLLRYQDWHRLPGYLWHALIQLMCEHHCRELCRGIDMMVQVQIPYKLSCAGWASARDVSEVFIAHIARLHINKKVT